MVEVVEVAVGCGGSGEGEGGSGGGSGVVGGGGLEARAVGERTCGMTMMHLYPLAAHTIASAIPVLPEV